MTVISMEQLREYREHKKNVVMKFLTSHFRDVEEGLGDVVDLPYFIKAHKAYNEMIKNSKDLTKYYKKIIRK